MYMIKSRLDISSHSATKKRERSEQSFHFYPHLGQLTPTIDSWKLALAIDLPTIHAVSSLQD